MRSKKQLLFLFALGLCLTGLIPKTAHASTYETYHTRGVKYFSYTKDTIDWDGSFPSISYWDGWQSTSGFFVSNEGMTKLNSSTQDLYYVNCKNKFLAGAQVSGVTLGWAQTFTDQVWFHYNGNYGWTLDI